MNLRATPLAFPLEALALLTCAIACTSPAQSDAQDPGPVVPPRHPVLKAGKPVPSLPGEVRLRNVRQITSGGENAEAYWSNDGKKLIMQSKVPPYECDQIFVHDLETGKVDLVSTGKGRTTCAYFMQGDRRILFSSTHLVDDKCPPPVMRVGGKYVWPIYAGYDIFTAKPDGSDLVRLTDHAGYDAEATVCPVTGTIVFTSTRDGDLELYSMEPDGSNLRRLTDRVGYDGGAFFSHDGSKLVLRSGFPADEADQRAYKEFLQNGLVVPSQMDITVVDRDGKNFRRVTDNKKANFAPFWHPDDRRIAFASNLNDDRGRNFEIFLIGEDGKGLEQITFNDTFDGFPMFSPDGKRIVFASNRLAAREGDTNVFVAEWVETP
jgi:Tol biopolymer transport system component